MKEKNKFEKYEQEITEVVAKYMDELSTIQLISVLEVKKLTLAHLFINNYLGGEKRER